MTAARLGVLSRSAVVVGALVAFACTPSDDPVSTPSRPPTPAQTEAPGGSTGPSPTTSPQEPKFRFRARLARPEPCSDADGFTCSTLKVPLDHSRPHGRTIALRVATEDGPKRRRTLLFLTGGPGQTGVGFAAFTAQVLAPLLDDYRVVTIDQRGTGARAIECSALQQAVGASDVLTAPPSAVRACARQVGERRALYTTADTVEDLELLRRALGVDEWIMDGVSYGTFVAQRYAIAYPSRVRGLVLDSVVRPDGLDTLLRPNLRRVAYALRDVCRDDPPCVSDPARDLARVVRQDVVDNIELLNALTTQSIIDPSFRETADVPGVLVAARNGDGGPLESYIANMRAATLFAADELSAGAHVATLCADLRFPWGDASAPLDDRRRDLRRVARRIRGDDVWPFDVATATGQGMIQSCLNWPPVPTDLQLDASDLPDIPVLLLHGERDLSTPLGWARATARMWSEARLVEIPNEGHSVQTDGLDTVGGRALVRFLQTLDK